MKHEDILSSKEPIILVLDTESRIIDASQSAATAYGYPFSELIGMSVRELRAVTEMVTFKRHWEKVVEQNEIVFESWHRRKDGTLFPVEVHCRLQKTESGACFRSVIHDISESKIDRSRERRLINIYRCLSATNDAIIHSQSESELMSSLCQIAVECGGMVMAWVGRFDTAERLVPLASYGQADGFINLLLEENPGNRCPACAAAVEGRHIVDNDFDWQLLDGRCRQRAERYGVKSTSTYPVRRGGQPYAVFVAHSDQAGAFDDEVVQLLEEMTKNISFALDNFDREAERRRVHDALQLTQYSLEIAVDPVFWVIADGSIEFVNEAACRYLGYTRQEMLNLAIMDIDPRITPQIWEKIWQEEKQQTSRKFETMHRTKDGRMIPVEITTNCVEYTGREYRFAFVRDISERKKSEEMIWKQANFDTLTDLPNRHMFMQRLEQEILRSHRTGLPLALLFVDLDYFKDINDMLGHNMGDALLKESAARLSRCVRQTDAVARLGGDEFTIILTDLADLDSVDRIAKNILKSLSEPFILEDEVAHVSASIGVTFCPNDAIDRESLLNNADQAMYAAKNQGRNRYGYYDASLQEAGRVRRQLIRDLRGALEGGQLHVVYQPIVELATGSIHKAEALLRWHHPERGPISPAEFIPLAEQTGMIVEIGDWVFREAAHALKRFREIHHSGFQVSINKSPVQFRDDISPSATWFDHLRELELDGSGIVIEITESMLMDSTGLAKDKLRSFRKAGMEISLDDFGTGYSSLSYLQKFDLDYLKIDRSFVNNLKADSENLVLCEAIIVMAHKLGIRVIAEGVETEVQRNLLANVGCDFAQGYLYSRPVPKEEFERLLGMITVREPDLPFI